MADFVVEDVEYLRHGDKPLLARLFRPAGDGPFPMMVDLHGGAWCNGNRTNDVVMNEALAKSGVLVAALDFRLPPDAGYPASVADIHYGIRWLKARARELKGRADRVGAIGISSGGHQAMLVAMRPTDGRYAAQALPAGSPAVDARLRCVVLCWPVIDPLGRYHYAKKLKAAGPPYPEVVDRVLGQLVGRIEDAAGRIAGSLAAGGTLLLFGNGGSAADAQHIAAELVAKSKV